jgi:ATPase subunit of ABC transporter with duplicated ATPase domains
MLNIHNLSVSFGGTYLFEEVTFRLGAGDRVGLVGKNGAGKSNIIEALDSGLPPALSNKEIKETLFQGSGHDIIDRDIYSPL